MNELFPWEDAPDAAALEAPGEGGERAGTIDEEPAPETPAPAVQPDGDPRELEQTTPPAEPPPAELPPDAAADERAVPASPESAGSAPHGDPLRPVVRERPVARKEYYSIGEVSELVGLPAHVLRYWESQFGVLNPSKNRSGNRAYQRKEIKLILLVKHLLYDEKYTVEGAKAKLDRLRRGGELQPQLARALDAETVKLLREELSQLRDLLTVA